MCGICGMLIRESVKSDMKDSLHDDFFQASRTISHRGPDRSDLKILKNPVNVLLDFERLSIMDQSTKADQPFVYSDGTRSVYTMCNGEIYNHKALCKDYDLHPTSGSDCEVLHLFYIKYGLEKMELLCQSLNSEHAFSILDVDMKTGDYKLILSSDRFGIRPLFVGWDNCGFYFASELQGLPCLETRDSHVERFKPRHYGVIEKKNGKLGRLEYFPYYTVKPEKTLYTDLEVCKKGISELLEDAVISRLESDRPYGCLLSGGLDSSLVAALAARHLKKQGKRLRTFSVGMPGGTDEKYAIMVSKFIDSDHKHVQLSEKDFLDAIPNVVKAIGSYDITTVRASTGQFLISQWIAKHTDIKVLLCGDFSDEENGSYKYFLNAPNAEAFHDECIRLLEEIHMYDGLRADRCISHFGIEARFPFADHRLIDFVLRCDPKLRMAKDGVEKWLLREAFVESKLLPEEVRNRVKEAMSDGISGAKRSWYTVIQEDTEKMFTDEQFEVVKLQYTHLQPISKESFLYRTLFCAQFGKNKSVAETIPRYWMPKWCGNVTDPSARVLSVYKTV